jgi:hypothetical protein
MNMATVRFVLPNSVTRSCRNCRHCEHDRRVLETTIPGLSSFGSAFGASVGESRLCRLHDRLVSPRDSCAQFSQDDVDGPGSELG